MVQAVGSCPVRVNLWSVGLATEQLMVRRASRRIDELGTPAVEYALFLAETRCLRAALAYLDSCKGRYEALSRAYIWVNDRRKQIRRRECR